MKDPTGVGWELATGGAPRPAVYICIYIYVYTLCLACGGFFSSDSANIEALGSQSGHCLGPAGLVLDLLTHSCSRTMFLFCMPRTKLPAIRLTTPTMGWAI